MVSGSGSAFRLILKSEMLKDEQEARDPMTKQNSRDR